MILDAAGSSMDNVLTNTCYVSNRDDLQGFNEVYAEFFTKDWPARTTVVGNLGSQQPCRGDKYRLHLGLTLERYTMVARAYILIETQVGKSRM
ncbi:MAG: hypothetical protein Ct9H300mP11_12240 [Chloroflexota bacterium]|nr:MAG: hypothetical protein Ct9H300mP11_12240 [Chloroflexota bacterium]